MRKRAKPYMNNVAGKLARIREMVLRQEDKYLISEEIKQLETMAHPEAWRLLGQNDLIMLQEFLRDVDADVLAAAIRDGGGPVIKKLLDAIERAKT